MYFVRKRFYLLLPIYLSFFIGLGYYEVSHPTFSTDSTRIGNYEIKVSTTPPVPEAEKNTKIHFQVLDEKGNPIEKFRMGVQIYYNEDLQKSVPPSDHSQGTYDLDFTFAESGNHIIRVDLFDPDKGEILSHAFNVGVLNFYMNMFMYVIIAGIAGAAGIIFAIMIYQGKIRKKR
jgi:hypothetical protein